jgi:hypothetical protein
VSNLELVQVYLGENLKKLGAITCIASIRDHIKACDIVAYILPG